jgi:hypothetical protein
LIPKAILEDNPSPNWDSPEKLFVMLMDIPKLEQRLKCWLFSLTLQVKMRSLFASRSQKLIVMLILSFRTGNLGPFVDGLGNFSTSVQGPQE